MTRPRPRALLALALLLALGATARAAAAVPERPGEDPALQQRIDAHQRVAGDRAVLTRGHVDVGPLFVGGRWTLMVHDDTAKASGGESVWRRPEQTVLRVLDAGRLKAPDDPAYAFLHAEPGAPVYVVPETQERDVVWVGWNTQDPRVMQTIDRGVTMTMTGVQGPGSLVVYLQSGSFSEPKVLWDSTARARAVWVDVNTHTHANWVFTKPGVYLVQVKVAADLVDGSTVTDTRELRFAVGSATRVEQAFATAWRGGDDDAQVDESAERAPVESEDDDGGGSGLVVVIIALLAVALAGGVVLLLVRGAAAKRRARALAARRPRAVEEQREESR